MPISPKASPPRCAEDDRVRLDPHRQTSDDVERRSEQPGDRGGNDPQHDGDREMPDLEIEGENGEHPEERVAGQAEHDEEPEDRPHQVRNQHPVVRIGIGPVELADEERRQHRSGEHRADASVDPAERVGPLHLLGEIEPSAEPRADAAGAGGRIERPQAGPTDQRHRRHRDRLERGLVVDPTLLDGGQRTRRILRHLRPVAQPAHQQAGAGGDQEPPPLATHEVVGDVLPPDGLGAELDHPGEDPGGSTGEETDQRRVRDETPEDPIPGEELHWFAVCSAARPSGQRSRPIGGVGVGQPAQRMGFNGRTPMRSTNGMEGKPIERATLLITVTAATVAFGVGFNLGAFDRVFFDALLSVWVISTLVLLGSLLTSRPRSTSGGGWS